MPMGYMGYAKLANVFLLTNSGGLNRMVNPLRSEAVWGAGWYNAAQTTNYADSQQHFEGSLAFELQGIPSVWNLFRDWAVEQRVEPQDMVISPNGLATQNYTKVKDDPRTGVWLSQAGFRIDAEQLVTVNAFAVAIRRSETSTVSSYKAIRVGPGTPTGPLNPSPTNRNPIPGWNCKAAITWPGAPAFYSSANPTGLVLRSADFTLNNNTQIIRGCTGEPNPVAVLQGTIAVDGNITVWRDGPIPDPYAVEGQPFRAEAASLQMLIGGQLGFRILHVLLTSDQYEIQSQNSPSTRTFGFAGLGSGLTPPLLMDAA